MAPTAWRRRTGRHMACHMPLMRRNARRSMHYTRQNAPVALGWFRGLPSAQPGPASTTSSSPNTFLQPHSTNFCSGEKTPSMHASLLDAAFPVGDWALSRGGSDTSAVSIYWVTVPTAKSYVATCTREVNTAAPREEAALPPATPFVARPKWLQRTCMGSCAKRPRRCLARDQQVGSGDVCGAIEGCVSPTFRWNEITLFMTGHIPHFGSSLGAM